MCVEGELKLITDSTGDVAATVWLRNMLLEDGYG